MTTPGTRLIDLLPAVYRLRDVEEASSIGGLLSAAETAELAGLESTIATLTPAEWTRLEELRDQAGRGPLAALLTVLGREVDLIAGDLVQLYEDQFVETAAPWALPYVGDLIGYRSLHDRPSGLTARAELGHTIAFRRRKGTAAMLEQLARDVTGWDAHVVEGFRLLATTQSMNHVRLANQVTPNARAGRALELVGSAFDPVPRTLDVRRFEAGGGRHNIPNIGISLWRLGLQSVSESPVVADPADATGRHFRFSPLGDDFGLCTLPIREDEIEHLAEPVNVPFPISRRRLDDDLATGSPILYGNELSLGLFLGGAVVPAADIRVCNLTDTAGGWAHDAPAGTFAIDPELGRIAVAADRLPLPAPLTASFHRAGPDGIGGGGGYPRSSTFAAGLPALRVRVPDDSATIQGAIAAVAAGGGGVVEITDSGRYAEALSIDIGDDTALEVRAADEVQPTIELPGPWTVRGGRRSRVFINGLRVLGDRLVVRGAANQLAELHVAHCTFVPGRRLDWQGRALQPGASSLAIGIAGCRLWLCNSIVGALRVNADSSAHLDECIVDAGREGNSYGASDTSPSDPGGPLDIESSTVIGASAMRVLNASNTILLGRVEAARRQEGCSRFSYAAPGSVVPRRYRCQPGEGEAARNVPHFASLVFGAAAYARLADSTPAAIATGSEDESEMGVWRRRYEPQRHADLHTRLDEYLRVGLVAGVIHES